MKRLSCAPPRRIAIGALAVAAVLISGAGCARKNAERMSQGELNDE
jgi:hypothetical protein